MHIFPDKNCILVGDKCTYCNILVNHTGAGKRQCDRVACISVGVMPALELFVGMPLM